MVRHPRENHPERGPVDDARHPRHAYHACRGRQRGKPAADPGPCRRAPRKDRQTRPPDGELAADRSARRPARRSWLNGRGVSQRAGTRPPRPGERGGERRLAVVVTTTARWAGAARRVKQDGCHQRGGLVVTSAEFATLLSPLAVACVALSSDYLERRS